MAEDFVLSGDPGSISASGRTWGEFSTSASTASTAIKGVQAGTVQGDEWTQFTDDINDKLPGHLDTTSEAWGIVSAALVTYADKLTGFQQRMSSLKSTYDSQQATAANAKANLDAAHRSDLAEKTRVSTATATLKPGETLPPSAYVSSTSGAQSSFTEANGNLQATVNAAAQVRKDHSDAVQAAVSDVNRAKGMRFQKPPGWFGSMMHSIGGWISDHADVLTKISSVLKTISGICGVLAFIPVVGEFFGAVALVAGGLALGIDVALKLATGQGSWTQIGLDAFSMIPGARAAKLAYGANVAYTGYNVATGKASLTDLAMVTGMGALSMKGGGKGEKFGGSSEGNRSTKFGEGESSAGSKDAGSSEGGGNGPSDTGSKPPAGDPIKTKLQQITDNVHTDFNIGKVTLTPKQQARVLKRQGQGKSNDFHNTYKGERIDNEVKMRVKAEQAKGDPDLTRVCDTPRFKFGPDFKNISKKSGEGDWYDVTTKKSWPAHVAKYTGRYGTGVPILWS